MALYHNEGSVTNESPKRPVFFQGELVPRSLPGPQLWIDLSYLTCGRLSAQVSGSRLCDTALSSLTSRSRLPTALDQATVPVAPAVTAKWLRGVLTRRPRQTDESVTLSPPPLEPER